MGLLFFLLHIYTHHFILLLIFFYILALFSFQKTGHMVQRAWGGVQRTCIKGFLLEDFSSSCWVDSAKKGES